MGIETQKRQINGPTKLMQGVFMYFVFQWVIKFASGRLLLSAFISHLQLTNSKFMSRIMWKLEIARYCLWLIALDLITCTFGLAEVRKLYLFYNNSRMSVTCFVNVKILNLISNKVWLIILSDLSWGQNLVLFKTI